jgi:hypothetical protein
MSRPIAPRVETDITDYGEDPLNQGKRKRNKLYTIQHL